MPQAAADVGQQRKAQSDARQVGADPSEPLQQQCGQEDAGGCHHGKPQIVQALHFNGMGLLPSTRASRALPPT